jgi:hypothetical protein
MTVDESNQTNRQCVECGNFEAVEVGDKFLCAECITQAGCSCGGGDYANVSRRR